MYLKKLELQGFKSFADKTVLEFKPGITTVIGPNGSGKSNISDAIRWVLGEQSMKNLRSSKAEDVIFAGTQNRKSLGFAECSIVIDNTDGKLPIEYSEVTVTRRIYRSGESGFFINKTPCRLRDVSELFMDTGIGKDGYSIISQGKIDEILSNKSEDRRHIFEEAAGIVKYRIRKMESEKKLEQTKLNLLRINDILSEIEANIEPLKLQSEKARKFLSLKEELKDIEIGLFKHNIDTYKLKLSEIEQDLIIHTDQSSDEQTKMNDMEQHKINLKSKIDEITAKIEEIQLNNIESAKTEEKLISDINIYNERIANNKANIENYNNEIENLNIRIQELELEKNQKNSKKISLAENKDKFEKELKEKESKLAEISKTLSAEEAKIEMSKRKIEECTDSKYEKATEINTQEITIENIKKRERVLKEELESRISELDKSRLIKDEVSKEFREIENKRIQINSELEKITAKKQESTEQINKYNIKINGLEADLRIKESRLKFLIETEKEKEGYVKSVKALLLDCEKDSELSKGVEGVLANLITLPKEYETAIEMCLTSTLQNIVTESEKEAKKLIEYLRKNNLGRASFLPITTVKGKKIDRLITNGMKGVIGIASDLVKTEKKYEQIIINLLGRTVVVEDMDTAILLARQNGNSFRIVTLKGDIINPTGSMSGGSVQQKTISILGRGREIEALKVEIEKLKKEVDKINDEKEHYTKSVESIIELVDGMERNLQETEIEYATSKEKILNIEQNIVKVTEYINKFKMEKIELSKQEEEAQKRKKQLEEDITELEKEISELGLEISIFNNNNKDKQKELDDLNFDITNLKISVSSFDESESSINEFVQRIEEEIMSNNKNINDKKNSIQKSEKECKELEIKIEDTNKQIEDMKKNSEDSGTKIDELKNNRIEETKKIEKIESDIKLQVETIENIKNQISKIEIKKSKIEFELEQIVNKMWEEYEITPNNVADYKKIENVNEVQKNVNHLREEIKNLGSINVDSIEEYKQTKERYDFVCEQRADLEEASTKLRKIINDMTNIMKSQFEQQFKIINKNFSEVFIELFGGGKAELILTDYENILDSGIEIEVQPPGKKLQNMMLLSGGERAFTAIALLFAILKINPAPFCVLDEIEAALDDANVYRFAEYLKKFAKETEFLVITHRKGTMEVADTVYGITMEENGISKLLSLQLNK